MPGSKDLPLSEGLPGVSAGDVLMGFESLLRHIIDPVTEAAKPIPLGAAVGMLVLGALPFGAGTLACFYYLWALILPGTPPPHGVVATIGEFISDVWPWLACFQFALLGGACAMIPALRKQASGVPKLNCFVYVYALALVVLSVITATIVLLQVAMFLARLVDSGEVYVWFGAFLLSAGTVAAMFALARRYATSVVDVAYAVGTSRESVLTRNIRLMTMMFTAGAMLAMLGLSSAFLDRQQDELMKRELDPIVGRNSPVRVYFSKCVAIGESVACTVTIRASKHQNFTTYGNWEMRLNVPAEEQEQADVRLSWSIADSRALLIAQVQIDGDGDQDIELRTALRDLCNFRVVAPPYMGLLFEATGKLRNRDVAPGQRVDFSPAGPKVLFDEQRRSCASAGFR